MQNLILEQLAGEGSFIKPNDRTRMPEVAFLDVTDTAKTALLLTPDDSVPVQSFTNIKHSSNL